MGTNPDYSWNPNTPGQMVRLRDNPGYSGSTTGKTRQSGTKLLVQVQFGPQDKKYKPFDILEPCGAEIDLFDLLREGRLGSPSDLRKVLTFKKVQGQLTNIFYSMETSNTDFYPHQFKPVLKFIESTKGRLLIADEVGLGKTIEAIYIWKELQARADARRLLIVCPAMLRHKWQRDLQRRFNIEAEVVDVRMLLEKLQRSADYGAKYPFVCISSLEGLRCSSNYEDETNMEPRAQIARLLSHAADEIDSELVDLAIIDEAHYLRNLSTASNRFGRLLRDGSKHLLLLTATPIQLCDENLYQLLRLVDQDSFQDQTTFDNMIRDNAPVVAALRHLWATPPDKRTALEYVDQACRMDYFRNNPVLKDVCNALKNHETLRHDEHVKLGYKLESCSLLGQFMVRTRKRDALEKRVERSAQTLAVNYSAEERRLYDHVTSGIRERTKGMRGIGLFSIMMRQRQMASSLVAALESWSDRNVIDELLWNDLGISQDLSGENNNVENKAVDEDENNTSILHGARYNIANLERSDAKYNELIGYLRREIAQRPHEKFVIFTYFRGTIRYLSRRLKKDGINAVAIMGGLGDDKNEIIDTFEKNTKCNVLLTTEVGSEGIDLQFCRVVVNYDLPWNPMRVEQRIGRIDRLGQKAEKISIINFSLINTIEETILERLYERIGIFRESIGELEPILGEMTNHFISELLASDLTDEERLKKAKELEQVIIKKREEQYKLENEAINLVAFSDFIQDAIGNSRMQGRWLHPDEMYAFVSDFFAGYYPGTTMTKHDNQQHVYDIELSRAAKDALQKYVCADHNLTPTNMHNLNAKVTCFFDPKEFDAKGKRQELIDSNHPLIRFIRHTYACDKKQFHPTVAIRLTVPRNSNVKAGAYAFVTHHWTFKGLREESRLVTLCATIGSNEYLSEDLSEELLTNAARHGAFIQNISNLLDMNTIIKSTEAIDDTLNCRFANSEQDFKNDNENRCNIQEKSAREYADRRIENISRQIHNFEAQGKENIAQMHRGKLENTRRRMNFSMKDIEKKRIIDSSLEPLAVGIIIVEGE